MALPQNPLYSCSNFQLGEERKNNQMSEFWSTSVKSIT